MKLYLAGCEQKYHYLDGLDNVSILVSYWWYKKNKKTPDDLIKFCKERNIPIFMDSGAYSAMTIAAEINVDEYIEFLLKYPDCFELIASLDVIGDHEATRENHLKMRQAGINSITSFHVGEPWEVLEEMLREENYIGIGGLASKATRSDKALEVCFRLKDEINPNCRLHCFGATSPQTGLNYDFYSMDSTAWIYTASKFGRAIYRQEDKITWVHLNNKTDFKTYWPYLKDEIGEGWIEGEGPTKSYEKIVARYNAKNLLELYKIYTYQPLAKMESMF
jgi:hypothetical protein